MSSTYLMALDAGGGGGHCLLVETGSGRFIRTSRPWTHPAAPGTGGLGSDLDLPTIWKRLAEAAREAMGRAAASPDQVLGVAATSMRHATVVLDAKGDALFAASNRDSRAVGEAFQIAGECGDALYARTGHWPSPLTSAARLRWLSAHDPGLWKRATRVLSLSDWVTYRLCGEVGTEPSQASETLLLDVEKRDWAWDVVEQFGIPHRLLAPLRQSGSLIGTLTAEAADVFGLRAGTPVAVGGADTQCGLLGAGAATAGQVAVIAGTTVPVQLVLGRARLDPKQRLWTGCHVVSGLWVLESNAGAMGEALQWFAGVFYPESPLMTARLLAEAGQSEPGAQGIVSTMGADVMNARELRLPMGTVTLSHLATAHDPQRRRHLARAIVEGMAYGLRANLEQLREVAEVEPAALSLAGGISRSDVFAQVVSDVVNRPVEVGASGEATALGAAICAGVGAGLFADMTDGARRLAGQPRVLRPDAARAAAYEELYGSWQSLNAARAEADGQARRMMLPYVLRSFGDAATARAEVVRPRILVTADMDDEALAALREIGTVEYASFRQMMRLLTGPTLVEALSGVQVFVTEVDVVDVEALRQLPELRVVVACRANAVNIDLDACTACAVPVLHAPGRNAEAVADLTLAFLLLLARKLPAATAFLRQPGIEPGDMGRMGQAFTTLQGRELWRKTVGLVGFGAVGQGVAKRAAAFGARVLVHDPYLRAEQVLLAGGEAASLEELLERSDFVSLHAALTDVTKSLIGAAELARMKAGAFLINTARAALVDEVALMDALRAGHIAGAALDVFRVEPPGSDDPLLTFENVIATPHVGGNTVEVATHQGRIIAEDLRRLVRTEPPLHVLNPKVLAEFDWTKPRPQPDAKTIEELASRPAPVVSDIQRERPAGPRAVSPAAAVPAAAPAAASGLASETVERMRRIVRAFVDGMVADASLGAFAAGKHVTLHFTVPDLDVSFYLRFREGAFASDLGAPEPPADVELRMCADVLDGMFTGRVNPMQAATSGRLSFSGDTVKAMTLQRIQADLSRLYKAAREQVGDPGDLVVRAAPAAARAGTVAQPVPPGDIREELVQMVNELYAAELITATGGNVSVRIPGAEEVWITPSQLFKGLLRPEMLVRIDLDGNPLDPDSLSPSSERLMHCAVYRARPEAQAVIHAHAAHATVLANSGLPFVAISTEAAFFGDIPRVPFIMPGTEELAKAVGAMARENWAVMMQNHGLIVGGRSLRRAADMVEVIERSAEVILGCYAVGKEPSALPTDVVEMLQKMGDLLA